MNEDHSQTNKRKFLKNFYQNERYVKWLFESVYGFKDLLNRQRVEFLLQQVSNASPSKILDIGCGGGWLTCLLATKIYAVGFDISFNILNQIRKLENLNLVNGDALLLPFKDDSFDMIICSEVLEHIPRCDLVIREMSRLLTDNGRAIITVPNLWRYDALEGRYRLVSKTLCFLDLIGGKTGKYSSGFEYDGHLHKMFPWKWRRLLKNEFIVIAEYPIFIWPYIPGTFTSLKIIERKMCRSPWFGKLSILLEEYLGKIRPFNYLGQIHAFVCVPKSR